MSVAPENGEGDRERTLNALRERGSLRVGGSLWEPVNTEAEGAVNVLDHMMVCAKLETLLSINRIRLSLIITWTLARR